MILILSGLPASGKTTRSLEWVAEDPSLRRRVNYDDIRVSLFGSKGSTYFSLKNIRQNESLVKAEALSQARYWLELNPAEHSVVIDNTNLTERAREPWVSLGKSIGVPVELSDMDTPVHECVRQDKLRAGDDRVGRAVIERMALFTGWIDWSDTETYKRRFVVVDIDGTLSLPGERLKHVRNPNICVCGKEKCPHVKDPWKPRWDLFHAEVDKDLPNEPVIELVQALNADGYYGYDIIVVSGRSPEHGCGIKTEDWLDAQRIPCRHLFMRQAGDYKPDYEHKQEILDLLPKDLISFTIDDRQQVVDMWRKNGLMCLQVAKGDF